MKKLPSRFRRLDGALADLPLEEPMLLTELDGFLTGVLLSPEAIPPAEWLASIWGADDGGVPPFDDPADVEWFAAAVTRRHEEIARDLSRGKPQPIFQVDDLTGEVDWDYWIDGFDEAMALRPDAWASPPDDAARADAMARLATLIAVARVASDLDSQQINALHDRATAEIVAVMLALYRGGDPAPAKSAAPKVGRNELCGCGSGRKSKRCCQA